MKKNIRKNRGGFTLVELLVVIAILAILAGVSVVGYLSFTKKANLSNDQTMIKMINDNLQASSVENKPSSASNALSRLYSVGFSSEKLEPFSKDHHYVYSLDENKFYLLDENDKAIFPQEKIDISNCWALYKNDSSYFIPNLVNYVALETVSNQQVFDVVFNNGGKLDLNNFILNVNNNSNKNIYVSNGSISHNATGFDIDNTVKEQTVFTPQSDLDDITIDGNKAIIENYYIEVANSNKFIEKVQKKLPNTQKEIIIQNTSFVGDNTSKAIWWDGGFSNTSLTIENSLFTNFGAWSFVFGSSASNIVYKIKNTSFINCIRGINIQTKSNMLPENEIIGNTFSLGNTEKSKAIQLADFKNEHVATLPSGNTYVKIANNIMKSGVAFINIHESLVKNNLSLESFDRLTTFENNTIAANIESVVLDTPDKPFTEQELAIMNSYKDCLLKKFS